MKNLQIRRHSRLASLFFLASSLLVGCAPVYQKFYTYEPMKKESQRTCAMSCQLLKQSCGQNQMQAYQLCQSNSQIEYQNCKNNERWGYNKKGKWECIDNCYCYESSCDSPDNTQCEGQYADCYRNCGGKVTETTRCVSNCENIQQQ